MTNASIQYFNLKCLEIKKNGQNIKSYQFDVSNFKNQNQSRKQFWINKYKAIHFLNFDIFVTTQFSDASKDSYLS